MNNQLKCLLITAMSIYITGCSTLGSPSRLEHITPVQDVSLNVGESMIVHGAVEQCGYSTLKWAEISHLLPNSETGFFSNAGRSFIKLDRCGGTTPALRVRFTANTVGSENLTVFGDPMNITVSNSVNFLQSNIPAPKEKAASEKSVLDTIFTWIER